MQVVMEVGAWYGMCCLKTARKFFADDVRTRRLGAEGGTDGRAAI